jgi:transposase
MANNGRSNSRRERKKNRPAKLKAQDWTLGLEVVHPKAAGIDVGNEEHYVAIPPSLDDDPVRRFDCFTEDLESMADWLVERGITTAVMQSTGVYWMALYDILEKRKINVFLVNARDTKNLPGRKTDVLECQWLLKLHVYGLLKNSFLPADQILTMRTYWRQRQQHIADASRCTQHIQKAFTQMNVQLANVLSDVCGFTGKSIIRAILKGERDPKELAKLRDPRVKVSQEVIAKSLHGNWREDLLFILKQEFESHQSFEEKIKECDARLYEHMQLMEERADRKSLGECPRSKRPRGNVPDFDLRDQLYRIAGVDLTAIDGVNVLTAQTIIAEVGYDMSRFAEEGNFVSWLNLAPNNRISGGKVIGRDRRKVVNRAGQALRQAASTLLRSQSYLGAQYRRLRAKLGSPKAVKAMAAKLARIIYRTLKFGQVYVDRGSEAYEQSYRQRQIKFLTKKAAELGLEIVHAA